MFGTVFGTDIGIDLGTASILVYIKGHGIVLHEPSVVAIDKNKDSVMAVGEAARRMLGRTPDNIVAVRPLREGVISDYDMTERMLRHFIQKAVGRNLIMKPRIAVCVPSAVTEVERRAVQDATRQAGARQVMVIEEPIAAAIGAGIDISRACGSMVVDIGGGTTDIAVISLGGIVLSTSLKVAGDNFDESIIRYMRKKHNLLIGERTAEDLKINIGTAFDRTVPVSMDIRGRNLITGLPRSLSVTSDEMQEALSESVASIVSAVHRVLEQTPPELASDISDRGIVMTGGGSLMYGLDKIIRQETGIAAIIAEEAVSCVAVGTGRFIEYAAGGKVEFHKNSILIRRR
jgi:rod shape-determining protein MreB